jgi:hypothetical protein
MGASTAPPTGAPAWSGRDYFFWPEPPDRTHAK